MSSGLIDIMKRAAVEAVDSKVPSDVVYGKVIKVKPVEIRVDSNLILKEADGVLKFARNVTDYEVEMTVNHVTEETGGGSGDASFASHAHGYVGKKKFKVHNALKVGETVIMIKKYGGQSYLVYDRLAVKS